MPCGTWMRVMTLMRSGSLRFASRSILAWRFILSMTSICQRIAVSAWNQISTVRFDVSWNRLDIHGSMTLALKLWGFSRLIVEQIVAFEIALRLHWSEQFRYIVFRAAQTFDCLSAISILPRACMMMRNQRWRYSQRFIIPVR